MANKMSTDGVVEMLERHGFELLASLAYGDVFVGDVTPKLAREFLELVPETQRNIRRTGVDRYSDDMSQDMWAWTGDVMQFGPDGTLSNGQHRCSASVKSGFTLEDQIVVVIREVSTGGDAILVLDNGMMRAKRDYMKMHLGWCSKPPVIAGLVAEATDLKNIGKLSRVKQTKIAMEHPYLLQCHELPQCPSGVVAAAARCMRHDEREAVAFFRAVLNNEHEVNGSRSEAARLIATWHMSAERKGGQAFQYETAWRFVRAFKHHIRGERPKVIRFPKRQPGTPPPPIPSLP